MKKVTCINKDGENVQNNILNHTVEGCTNVDVNLGTYESVTIFTGTFQNCKLFIEIFLDEKYDFVEIQRNYTNKEYSTIKRYYK